MIPRRHKPQEENTDSWLMSYADMITLLLCFFIIFVSVSEPKKDKMTAITDGMGRKFGGTLDMATPFGGLYRELVAGIEKRNLLHEVTVLKTKGGVELEMASGSFFENDSAELDKESLPYLQDIADSLHKLPDESWCMDIESHTSDAPPKGKAFASNWELSAARAARLVRYFIGQGIKPVHFKATGYADTRPSVPNLDINGNAILENRAKNQRVILKIEH